MGPMAVSFTKRGEHEGVNPDGFWFQHLYPVDDEQCWCGWRPAETTVTVTAAQHGVLNPDGTWTIENWEASDAESKG